MRTGRTGGLLASIGCAVIGCASSGGNLPDAAGGDAAISSVADAQAEDAANVDAPVMVDAGTYDASFDAGFDAGDSAPPTVESSTPANGSTGSESLPAISVTFSEAINPATLTTNTSDNGCSGSFQLSDDGFSTCAQMSSAPASVDGSTFTISPAAPLTSAVEYAIRVTPAVEDRAGNALASQFESSFTVRYGRTIVLDGFNDFGAANLFASSSDGATIYISHDDRNLYLGFAHDSIRAGGFGNRFLHFLFSIDPTLSAGSAVSSDGRAKFGAAGTARMAYHWKERIDGGNYTEFRVSDGSNWDADWGATGKVVHKIDGYVEASIELTEFGGSVPAVVLITTFGIDYEGNGGDGAVFGMLRGATDGPAPAPVDLYGYIELDLPSSQVPNHADHWATF